MHNKLYVWKIVIWKLSYINDSVVPKSNEEKGWAKNYVEVLEPLWKTGDILSNNLEDIPNHQNVDKTGNDKQNLNDNTGWDSGKLWQKIYCNVNNDGEIDEWIHN